MGYSEDILRESYIYIEELEVECHWDTLSLSSLPDLCNIATCAMSTYVTLLADFRVLDVERLHVRWDLRGYVKHSEEQHSQRNRV